MRVYKEVYRTSVVRCWSLNRQGVIASIATSLVVALDAQLPHWSLFLLNHLAVRDSPWSSPTFGSHPSTFLALVMSGWRRRWSPGGNGRCFRPEPAGES